LNTHKTIEDMEWLQSDPNSPINSTYHRLLKDAAFCTLLGVKSWGGSVYLNIQLV